MIETICTRQNPDGTYDSRGWKNRTNPSIDGFDDESKLMHYVRSWGAGHKAVKVKYYSDKQLVRTVYVKL
jgi:hypothetical protein